LLQCSTAGTGKFVNKLLLVIDAPILTLRRTFHGITSQTTLPTMLGEPTFCNCDRPLKHNTYSCFKQHVNHLVLIVCNILRFMFWVLTCDSQPDAFSLNISATCAMQAMCIVHVALIICMCAIVGICLLLCLLHLVFCLCLCLWLHPCEHMCTHYVAVPVCITVFWNSMMGRIKQWLRKVAGTIGGCCG
jgi:hypothetical protein